MPEHLRALVVILVLATGVFIFAKAPACALASATGDFERRRNLWFGITLTAFLAHNFWIYIGVAAALLLFALPREPNKLAMFFFLLFAVPAISAQITGLGIIEHFFTIHYVRLLALAVLLPSFLDLHQNPGVERFGRTLPDKLIAGYILLNLALMLPVMSFTNSLRAGVFYAFIDIFLPYYVASRSLKDLQGFRDALMSFAIAAMILAVIGVFEFARHWLLYSALQDALGTRWDLMNYLERGGALRAQGTTGQPIPFGYVMAIAAGFFLYLRKLIPNSLVWGLGIMVLLGGLVASLSRGPWIGAAAMLLVFIVMSPRRWALLALFGLLGVILLPLLLLSPVGGSIVSYLPFVGSVDAGTVTYRQRLVEVSLEVIRQNPFFGASDFINLPVMQEMMQGQRIIDIVNSYLGVTLANGVIGLALFAGFFLAVATGIFRSIIALRDSGSELHLLGQSLFCTLLGIMVIIATVSSISVVPAIYWSVAGLGVAYTRMLALARAPAKAPETAASPPVFGQRP